MYEESKEERTGKVDNKEREGEPYAMRGLWEVQVPPGGRRAPEDGKDRASNRLRNAMEGMEMIGDPMDEEEVTEEEGYNTEVEGGGTGGAPFGTGSHRAPDSG